MLADVGERVKRASLVGWCGGADKVRLNFAKNLRTLLISPARAPTPIPPNKTSANFRIYVAQQLNYCSTTIAKLYPIYVAQLWYFCSTTIEKLQWISVAQQ